MDPARVIALDLGGTKLATALCSRTGKLTHKSVVELNGRGGREVGKLVAGEALRLLEKARAGKVKVSGIGVSVPGISYEELGVVWAPNIPGWEKYPLRKEIESVVDDRSIQVTVESDRACCVLAETWRGASKGARHAIFLAVGTGIGAGILVNGEVLRGAQDIAGAIGWLALDRPFRAEYISCGCFEYHASGAGLAKVARELGAADREQPITARDVFARYHGGDKLARRVITEAIGFWGMAVANLVSLFNPEVIVFGGGVFGPAKQFLPKIAAAAKKWAQPIAIKHVKIMSSKLGTDAALIGAACRALNQP